MAETPRPWYRESARAEALGGWIVEPSTGLIGKFYKVEDRNLAVTAVNAHAELVLTLRMIGDGEFDGERDASHIARDTLRRLGLE